MVERGRPSHSQIWGVVIATALVTDVVGALLLSDGGHTVAFVAGELLVPLIAVGGIVGGIAMAYPRRWRVWYAVPLVAVVSVGLHLSLTWVEQTVLSSTNRNEAGVPRLLPAPSDGGSAAPSPSEDPTSAGHRLSAPFHVTGWRVVATAQADRVRETYLHSMHNAPVVAVARMYQRSSGELALFMGMMPTPGSSFRRELLDSHQVLVDYLAGAHILDPTFVDAGPLGGRMACGEATLPGGSPDTLCAWADHGSLGAASFVGQSLPVPRARSITLELRTGTTLGS